MKMRKSSEVGKIRNRPTSIFEDMLVSILKNQTFYILRIRFSFATAGIAQPEQRLATGWTT
jgi:hypothetical protein